MTGMAEGSNSKRVAGAFYLILFVLSEIYSAAATALDKSPYYPPWEPQLGRGLFLLPCLLVAGMFLLLSDRDRTVGISLSFASLGLYGAFFVFESFAFRGEPNPKVIWVDWLWAVLFLPAFLAVFSLKRRIA
jgi:hypothetical protein